MWGTLFTILVGAVGYVLATFYFRPVLRYVDLKGAIAADLVLYANALPDTVALDERVREASQAYRRHAAALAACEAELHPWYLWWRAWHRGERPGVASSALIGMSNAADIGNFERHRDSLYKRLHVPRVA